MTRLTAILQSVQGRLTTGLVLAANSGVEGALWSNPAIGIAPRLTFSATLVASGVAWAFANLQAGSIHPHDLQLGERIRDALGADERRFLRENDFGWSFSLGALRGVRDVANWTGPEVEFHDKQMQKSWSRASSAISLFVKELARLTAPVRGNVSLQSVHPTMGDPEDPSEKTLREIDQLNQLATQASKTLDELFCNIRDRLSIAL